MKTSANKIRTQNNAKEKPRQSRQPYKIYGKPQQSAEKR